MFRRLAFTLPAAAVGVLVFAAPALAVTPPSGSFSIRPNPGTPQSIHYTANSNPMNYDTQAEGRCSDLTLVRGPWVTGTGNLTTSPDCSSGGHGHLIEGLVRYRQSSPITISCWDGQSQRNGSC